MKSLLSTLAVLLLVAGCETRQVETLPTGEHLPDEGAIYTTGETDVEWPSYDLPLVVQVEVPEVPEGIVGPSPEIPPDEDQGQD